MPRISIHVDKQDLISRDNAQPFYSPQEEMPTRGRQQDELMMNNTRPKGGMIIDQPYPV